jgi:ABC-type Fe3+-hydroxamate transport system substrate-binding protein
MLFTDQMNRPVEMPVWPPRRIVSVVPSQTEMLFDWGLEGEVVGVTKFCVHPAEKTKTKSSVGGTKKLHLERIAALAPDLIVGNKEENERADMEWLFGRFPVWMSDIVLVDDALDMMERLGEAVGRPEAARETVSAIRSGFAGFAAEAGERPRRAAYLIWRKPYMAAAGGTFIHEMLRTAGFSNVFGDLSRYPVVDLGMLAAADPEVVLLSSEPYPFAEKHFGEFRAACPRAEVRLVDGEMFSWYGTRLLRSADYFRSLRSAP